MYKVLYLFLLIALIGMATAFAHPSGFRNSLDDKGGHNCWSNCEQWGLRQGEYHLHEKE